jgi:Cdc6-like AAA superfamily ATPase
MNNDEKAELLARADTLSSKAIQVFKPRTPITTKELFAGRWGELKAVADAVHQAGLHVVIYGERGVGKTSLANVVHPTIWALERFGMTDEEAGAVPERLVIKAVANSSDTFSSIWNKVFDEITWPDNEGKSTTATFLLPVNLSIDHVRKVLAQTPGAVFIIDEFDQAPRGISKQFTELIKALQDLVIDSTVIVVGVSETVDNLIANHASINRALIQIPLKRMKPEDLRIILQNAETPLGIKFSQDSTNLIVHISQGLPHYTHLIGLHAVRSAANRLSLQLVEREDVFEALKKAVKEAEQTVTDAHLKATRSSHKTALYRHVLLGCALAAARSQEPLGYFNPSAIVEPLNDILQKDVTIASFTNHLAEFCQDKRGNVLERDGQPWGYRYRFRNPLLVPFVFMDGLESGITNGQGLVDMLSREN